MNSAAVDFGNRVKSQREYKQLSQSQLAKIIGKTQSYVSLVENGKYMPTKEVANEFARAIDVNVNYLLGKETQVPITPVTKEEETKSITVIFPKKNTDEAKEKEDLAPNTLDVQSQIQKNLDYLFKKTGDQYFVSPKTNLNTLVEIANHYKLPVSYLFENHEKEWLKEEIENKYKEIEEMESKLSALEKND
jgi:transcriptional regulator with XRE-family HTH domain